MFYCFFFMYVCRFVLLLLCLHYITLLYLYIEDYFQYRVYGESVIHSCIQNGASHVDICGEPSVSVSF